MPARWSSGAALVSSAARASSRAAAQRQARSVSSSCRVALQNSPAAAARRPPAPTLAGSVAPLQRRLHSSSPSNSGGGNSPFRKGDQSTLSTLSAFGHLLAAGTGTFASTLFALYLATVVESSAHDCLYECFPHWYSEVREEDLPICLREREILRRNTGVVKGNRAHGVEGLVDGWMDVSDGGNRMVDAEEAELLAEAAFERQQEERGIGNAASMSGWQRRMTENQAEIIALEEKEFSRGISSSASSEPQKAPRGEGGQNRLAEARRVQEEAARKLQERLASVAMTA